MTFHFRTVGIALAGALALSACETSEGWGQMVGALGGAALGVAIAGDDDPEVVALAAVAGAGLGMWIGGNVGRGLDQRERERLAGSTQQVLAMEVPSGSPLRDPNGGGQYVGRTPSASWTSPSKPNSVSGKSTLVGIESTGGTGECRTVRQLVVKNGEETSEDARFCRTDASSPWAPT